MIYTYNEAREKPLRLDLQLLLGKGEHINCVRFMVVDGQEYLVIADEVPPPLPPWLLQMKLSTLGSQVGPGGR